MQRQGFVGGRYLGGCRWRRLFKLAGAAVILAAHGSAPVFLPGESRADPAGVHQGGEDEETTARAFLYKEAVFSGFYSPKGVRGIPSGDSSKDHFELSPRPPGNYAGVDYVRTLTARSLLNTRLLPDWLPASAIDLHPRLIFERMENEGGINRIKLAPQDFWVRLNPGRVDRLTLRVGQFVIPYGVNPIMAPRQRFLLPLEATDLGLKWDWGADVKGPLGEYDWEVAATTGWGEGIHIADREAYLLTGRIGAPTYWDLQYGLSILYGNLPMLRAAKVVDPHPVSRWRIGIDQLYKYGTYLMAGTQFTYGQDGFAGGARHIGITKGDTADALGALAWADWVVPGLQDLRLALQIESVIRDLDTSHSDDTAAIFEVGYSILTSLSAMLDYRTELNRSMGENDHAIFLTFVYYGS